MNGTTRGPLRAVVLSIGIFALGNLLVHLFDGGLGGGMAAAAPGVKTGPVKIGFLVDSLQGERWQRDADALKKRGKELGATVVVEDAKGDDERQLQQARSLIASGAKAIVLVAHDTDKASRIVAAAKARHVAVVCYERLVPNSDVDFYAGPNTVHIGEMQAAAMAKLAPKGNYILVEGSPVDSNANLLHVGHLRGLMPFVNNGDIHVVGTVWAKDWSPVAAYADTLAEVEKAKGNVAAIVASNDGTAGGSIQALTDLKLAGKVPVSGQDADLAAIVRILNGTQSMTIYRPLRSLAGKAAEVAVQLARGETVQAEDAIPNGRKNVPAYLVGVVVVTKNNVMSTVIKDGFQNLDTIEKSVPREKWPQ